MDRMDMYDFVSPLDYRYYGGNKKYVSKLSGYFSENAKVKYQLRVEEALVRVFAKKKICSGEIAREISNAISKVKPGEVYAEEKRIKHDVRALVNCIRKKVSKKARPFVHLTLTSYDVVDTADALRYKEGTEKVILPALKELEKILIRISKKEASTLQVGRTHGQFASPVTFGFAIAEYVQRLGKRIEYLEYTKDQLVGKVSGAVGAYNASSIFVSNPVEFEKALLKELGLKTGGHSTQITEREPLLDHVHGLVSAFGVIANLADDLRHLQRSEIGEVYEEFGSKQVGSSTMPHKRNPISFENVKSLWKEFMPRINTLYIDQISEHQRDLSNSASGRFTGEIFVGLFIAADKMSSTLERLKVNRSRMKENFEKARGMIAAEPLYVLLAFHGHENAHEHVRRLTLKAGKDGSTLFEEMKKDKSLEPFTAKFSSKQISLIKSPEKYTGKAEQKALQLCRFWKKELKI